MFYLSRKHTVDSTIRFCDFFVILLNQTYCKGSKWVIFFVTLRKDSKRSSKDKYLEWKLDVVRGDSDQKF